MTNSMYILGHYAALKPYTCTYTVTLHSFQGLLETFADAVLLVFFNKKKKFTLGEK